jgi:hypothetical protein
MRLLNGPRMISKLLYTFGWYLWTRKVADPQCFYCTTIRDVIFTEGDFRECYINDLYTTHALVCWITALNHLSTFSPHTESIVFPLYIEVRNGSNHEFHIYNCCNSLFFTVTMWRGFNSTNVLDEGLRIGEIGCRMNSKVKSVKQGGYESKRGCKTWLAFNLSHTIPSWPL